VGQQPPDRTEVIGEDRLAERQDVVLDRRLPEGRGGIDVPGLALAVVDGSRRGAAEWRDRRLDPGRISRRR
jgi:hypothetical protein